MKKFVLFVMVLTLLLQGVFATNPPTTSAVSQTPTDSHLFGHVVDAAYAKDQQTRGIDSFNDYIMNDSRVERVILPLRDGLTLIRKKGELT